MNRLIEFKNVSKRYGQKTVIESLDLTIHKGEFFVLVGPSGSGKTTTMKMINALIEPTDGNVYFKERRIKDYNIQKMRWQIGYVLQQIALFPTMTVKQNIEVIPEMLGWDKKRRLEEVDRLLLQVGLDPDQYRDRLPKELSGGEQQRIGILRAIAANPEVILMDEPFSALDPISRNALQELMLTLHRELKTTIVFVTHNMQEALKLGDRIAVMHNGTLIQCDTPEMIMNKPKTAFVADFFEDSAGTNQQTATLKQLVEAGYLRKETERNLPTLDINEGLANAYPLLANSSAICIIEKRQPIGEIQREDVFAFLSQKEVFNKHEQ